MMPIDLPGFPTLLANAFGVNEFLGGILASLLLIMLVILPVLFLTRGRNLPLVFGCGFLVTFLCAALGWLPIFAIIIYIFIIALMFASFARRIGL